jgi:formamidopyrimidine-DNA glycosylase
MPELPEVESVVRALAPVLTGRAITDVEVLSRSAVSESPEPLARLIGRPFERFLRRGKYILAECAGGYMLAVHLRMTGRLLLRRRADLATRPERFVRVELALDGAGEDVLLFCDTRKFGRLWCGPRERILALRSLARLGPEPLEITAAEFAARLRARRGRLKSVLLDQTFLAGLGNIYADEALFGARLHPLRPAHRVPARAAARLHRAIQGVLRRALAAGGTTLRDYLRPDGSPGWFARKLRAYGREDEPCPRCHRPIRRIVVGQRGTWFCPSCQRR